MSEWKRLVHRIKITTYVLVSIPYTIWTIVLFSTQAPADQDSTIFGSWIFLTILWLISIGTIKMVAWVFGGNNKVLKKAENIDVLKKEIQELRNVIKKLERDIYISNPKDFRNEIVKYPECMHKDKGITS